MTHVRQFVFLLMSLQNSITIPMARVTKVLQEPLYSQNVSLVNQLTELSVYNFSESPFEDRKYEFAALLCRIPGFNMLVTTDPWVVQHRHAVTGVKCSLDSKRVMSISSDWSVQIFDIDAQDIVGVIRHNHFINDAQLSSDGKYAVAGAEDGVVKILDIDHGREWVEKHEKRIRSVQCSTFGNYVISASDDGRVNVFDVRAWKVVQSRTFGCPIRYAGFGPNDEYVMILTGGSGDRVFLINVETFQEMVVQHRDWIQGASFSDAGDKIITASKDKTVKIVIIPTGKEVILPHTDFVYQARLSHDGKHAVTVSFDHKVRLFFDVFTSKIRQKELLMGKDAYSAYFNARSDRILIMLERCVLVLDLEQKIVATIKHEDQINFASFSSDGNAFMTASCDETATLCDLYSQEKFSVKHEGLVHQARLSADKKLFITCSQDGTAKIARLGLHQLSPEAVLAVATLMQLAKQVREGKKVEPLDEQGWVYRTYMRELSDASREHIQNQYPEIETMISGLVPS